MTSPKAGRYQVFAGVTPHEILDISIEGPLVNIDGPHWFGSGNLTQNAYRGIVAYKKLVPGIKTHRAFHQADWNGEHFDVLAFFDGLSKPAKLTWKPV